MIPRIVLTGGPCGGKTTALTYLQNNLPKHNIVPVLVPELATLLYGAGIRWPEIARNEANAFRFQVNMIKTQILNEDQIYSFASLVPGLQRVMICDRGTIDNMVYAKNEWHDDILSQVGTLGYLKRRYDGIIHLDTLALGNAYDLNNVARYESKEEAIAVDQRTYDMWHAGPEVPHWRIAHDVDLEKKMQEVLKGVKYFVDLVS